MKKNQQIRLLVITGILLFFIAVHIASSPMGFESDEIARPRVASYPDYNYTICGNGEGSANNQFYRPMRVAVNPITGHVYVTDEVNCRVQVFDSARIEPSSRRNT